MLVSVSPLPTGREPGPYRVCLVCMGNICRSPMAEVVLRDALDSAGLADLVTVSSAGTGDWHIGQRMAAAARAALARRDYDGSAHRARQFERSWFGSLDLVLAMDSGNLATLRRMGGDPARVVLFGALASLPGEMDIPDPYGGEAGEFDYVLGLLESAAPVIVSRLGELVSPRPA
jgi:protein-tyrosine phosphatase